MVTAVLARGDKITLDELYSLLLNHENRIEEMREKIASDVVHNMTINFAIKSTYSGENNGGFQKNFGVGNSSVYGTGQFNNGANSSDIVCQIFFIPGHGAYKCKNIYNSSFVLKETMVEVILMVV